jgi:hypothetical protein
MTTHKTVLALLMGFSVAASALVTGCGDSGSSSSNSDLGIVVPRDIATTPADLTGVNGDIAMTPPDLVMLPPDLGCYAPPTINSKHVEIINACTTAQQITKNPKLPLLPDSGVLPALP